jgi:SWI/SNF-related matrix-associated actin-dependent regulator 1 of chromatin subfamily A
MEIKIPEIEARTILLTYEGSNNQLLDWKRKIDEVKNFKLTRPQAEYVMKYYELSPKVARKYINLVSTFGEKIMEERLLPIPPEKIWCEKLLCESDKAYHIWGKVLDSDQMSAMWLPKSAIQQEEKKLNRVIDYSPYDNRPPMEHQKVAIEKLLANNKFILADDMGLGKTTAAVIASMESGAKKVLIVCPASLKINWDREIKNYTDRKVLIVEGRKWGSTFDYYIINYDILKNYHTTEKSEDSDDYKLLVNEKFDLAIVDEAHYVSNATANRTRLLNDVLETIPRVWLLTGTPMTSRPINYFNLLKIVDSPLTLNWQSYVRRYCKGYQFSVGNRKVWNTSGASNLDELRERTKSYVLRRMKTDILDLPEKIVTPVFVELTSKMYDEELEEFTRISNDKKDNETISVTLNRLMKIRQLIAYEKIPYTCEIIDKCLDQGKKVIVFTNFTMSLDMLHEKYKKNSVILNGSMSKEKKQESVDRFQNEDKVKIFISNIIAGGVGITLTAGEVVIMNDLSFVPAHHSQAEDRAYRYGQQNSVLVYYPVFENTVEKIIYNILQKKKGIIDQVMGDGEYSESFSKDLLKSLL